MTEQRPITERLLDGEKPALARLISWAENGDARFPAALKAVYANVGRAWRTGVTGPPGAGKSTAVNEMARLLRERGKTVGILAVDPSSPFSGGALLGDRIRMEERTMDEGVFIRSMASRESHGGLARASVDACDVMDAYGFSEVVIETVGVGQAEYDVMSATDTVVVILCPGAGDGVQAMKSGLLEVADVLVVNKSDLPGADRMVVDLEEAVHIRTAGKGAWAPPVVSCSAGTGKGVEGVLDAIDGHRAYLADGKRDAARRGKRAEQVKRVVSERLDEVIWSEQGYAAEVEALLQSDKTPYDVAAQVLGELLDQISQATIQATTGGANTDTR